MQQLRKRVPARLALLGVLVVLCIAFGSTAALASDCAALGGIIAAGQCQVSTAVTASDAAHGGPFVLDETLHITGSGSITVPPASGASLTLKITGDLIMDVPTVANRSRIVGDVTTASGVGATITIEASRNIVLNGNGTTGARISSNQVAGSCAGGGGGDITLRATATIITDKGSSITSTSLCPAGEIILDAGLGANIGGLVLSDGTSTIGRGGPITIASTCTLTIADSGQVISRGKDPGADLVHLEGGCSVAIHGLVASTGHGHVLSPPNRCHGPERPDKPRDAAACVEVWSGGTLTIDRAIHNAEVQADSSIAGGVQCCAWIDLIASGDIQILGSTTSAIFAVHANQILTNGYGGHITAISTTGKVTASGRAIQANAAGAGGHAGAVSIEAKQDVTLNKALIFAQGDFVPTYGSGGTIEVRSYNGGLSWTNPTGGLVATGDVRPTGAGVAAAIRGVVDVKSCGSITTAGTLFPITNGAATGPVPTAGLCPPAEAAAPALQPYVSLPPCICAAPKPDVSVVKTTSTPTVNVGGSVSYTIAVTAGGTAESTGVKLTDVLATGTTWTVSGPDASACTPASPVAGGAMLTCNFGTMAVGESKTLTLTGKAAASHCPTLANTAVVSAENDGDPSNDTSGPIPIAVTCNPDVAVVKTSTTPKITAGGTARYSITVTAGGSGSSANVKLTDDLPAGFTWTITGDTATCTPASPVAGGTTLTCNFGTMAQGTSKTIQLSATTTASQCVTIANTAAVTSSRDGNSVNNTSGTVNIVVECKPDVSVSKKTSDATIAPGEKAQYTVTVTAGGTGASTNVVMTDVLPTGFTWTVGGAEAAFCSPASPVAGGSALTCNFGTMSQGSTRTVTLEATATAAHCGAAINNTATVTADVDTVTTNNSSGPVKIEVKCPDVKVVKTTTTPTVSAGGTAKYAIVVTAAAGSVPATGVVLTDVLPSGLSWTVGGADAGKCSPASPVAGGSTLTCQFGDMTAGSTRTITLAATTTTANCPFIYNTATVSATVDSDPANNTSGPVAIALTGCSGVVPGKTKGFWGNDNGHAVIDPDKNGTVNTPVSIGGGTRGFTVTTVAQSDKILGNDACTTGTPTIFAPCTFSTGLNENTLENLASQTLALTYNIGKIGGYSGQSMATLGCTAKVTSALSALGLSGTSTVNQVQTVANSLINTSKSGGTTTQTQAGDMNALLGDCVNQE